MKTNKRSYLFAVLVVLLMAFAVLPGSTETVYAEGSWQNIGALKIWIEPEEGTAIVCGWAEENTSHTELTIPATVEYGSKSYKVTKIENSAFKNDSYITTLTVEKGIQEIVSFAFGGCTNLEDITLPDTLTSIGNEAFYDTEYYKKQENWESGVLYIGNYLIIGYLGGEYTVKDGTKLIADHAFSDEGISKIMIPASVERIGQQAFLKCQSLSQVTFEAGSCLKYIGPKAFNNCTSLTSINLPESVIEIARSAFFNTGLTSIVLSEGLERINEYTFANCAYLKEVTIPSTVKEIESGAFNDTPLETIHFGGSPSQWAAITGDGKPDNELVEFGKNDNPETTLTSYKITKAANPLKIKGKTATIKYSKLKKKNQTLAVKKVIKVTKKGKGKLTYKKASGSKKITINKKTGKVTVKKGLKKGKYKVKVKVKAAGNKNYKASKAKKATFTIVVQ